MWQHLLWRDIVSNYIFICWYSKGFRFEAYTIISIILVCTTILCKLMSSSVATMYKYDPNTEATKVCREVHAALTCSCFYGFVCSTIGQGRLLPDRPMDNISLQARYDDTCGLMLVQRLRRWPNINSGSGKTGPICAASFSFRIQYSILVI